ncbi:MAG TPA: hypothetical protein VFB41_05270 [Solirubrobacteraceae bacterium]|nr:hypothetical protein [Solirubrobacteraceae bacterium]
MTTRRFAAAGAVLALALGASGCGNKKDVVTQAETEGIYLDVGPVTYQVQISRQLNPAAIPEDRTFVSGVAAGEARLGPGEAWFAVFIRAENESDDPQPAATAFEISDTDGHHFEPIEIGPENPFRWAGGTLKGRGVLPGPNSVAGQTSINGLELLFKIKVDSLDSSRPLKLEIHSPRDPKVVADVDLDV